MYAVRLYSLPASWHNRMSQVHLQWIHPLKGRGLASLHTELYQQVVSPGLEHFVLLVWHSSAAAVMLEQQDDKTCRLMGYAASALPYAWADSEAAVTSSALLLVAEHRTQWHVRGQDPTCHLCLALCSS